MSARTPGLWALTPAQADGMACVVCEALFLRVRVAQVPVGVSELGSRVYACREVCERYVADALTAIRAQREKDDAGAGEEFATTHEVFGADSALSRLLRDLRILGGAEALLTVTEETGSISDLLALTARHASAVVDRSKWVRARLPGEQ